MEGYLEKKKIAPGIQSFKTRYCRINTLEQTLEYYTSPLDKKPKGVLKLLDLHNVVTKADHKLRFSIDGASWAYIVECYSEAERDAWVSHLQVWIDAKDKKDHIPIPPILKRGILACIEYCTFYGKKKFL
jgi:hypothetical protein